MVYNTEYVQRLEQLVIDLLDGKSSHDLIHEGFCEGAAEDAIELLNIALDSKGEDL